MIEDLIKHFEEELKYIESGDKTVGNLLINILNICANYNSNFTDANIKLLLNKCINALNTNVLSPLTLNEGEFKYIQYGLSQNRRNPYIFMDIDGMFYDKAFVRNGTIGYDSFTGKTIEELLVSGFSIDELDINKYFNYYDDERIFIIAGSQITPIYFNKAYIKQKDINKNYYPPQSIVLNLDIILDTNNKKYINCIKSSNPSLLKLNSIYRLNIQEDGNKDLIKFGVNFKYNKNAVYNEKRSAFCL